MGILNRFLLFLFALVSVAAGGALVVVAARLLPQQEWLSLVEQYAGRPECLAGLAIYLIVGLHLLVSSLVFRSKEQETRGELTLVAGTAGNIQVSSAAVRDVAERAAHSVRGVRDVHARIKSRRPDGVGADSTIRLSLQLILGTETPVRETADAVHEAVQAELSSLLGFPEVDIALSVSEITQAKLPNQPRVS